MRSRIYHRFAIVPFAFSVLAAQGCGAGDDDMSVGAGIDVSPPASGLIPGPGASVTGSNGQFTGSSDQSGGLNAAPGVQPGAASSMGSDITTTSGGNPNSGSVAPSGSVPCEINTVVQSSCQKCHGATPNFGAPMSLVTLADFQKDYMPMTTAALRGQTLKVYELARIRINGEMGTTKMPQGEPLTDAQLKTLDSWLADGAPAGEGCADGAAGAGGAVDSVGTESVPDGDNVVQDPCDTPGAYDPLVAEGDETCYDFTVHGQSGPNDTSKFQVIPGESYNEYYYDVPWPSGSLVTRFGTRFDQKPVLHHWLMFANNNLLAAPGDVITNVTGTTLGTDSELVAGWAVGGCSTAYPADVGIQLPTSALIMVQWHHYNNTGATVADSSAAQVCVVPAGSRPHTAGITFLGTENISVPPGANADASGSCVNTTNGPITVIGFTPHMHTIGIHMKSVVQRATGETETVFDKPFQFDYQTAYLLKNPLVLQPGDTIISTCTYQNSGSSLVGFGESTNEEMCYQFTASYPYGALNNGVPSLIGASNTCWQLGE